MTDREARAARNQQNSLAAFLAKKAEFDALLAELQQASADHFGADPEAVLWGEAAWLARRHREAEGHRGPAFPPRRIRRLKRAASRTAPTGSAGGAPGSRGRWSATRNRRPPR